MTRLLTCRAFCSGTEPRVAYLVLVSEFEYLHERALKQHRIDAVLAAVTIPGASALSDCLCNLPASILEVHSNAIFYLLAEANGSFDQLFILFFLVLYQNAEEIEGAVMRSLRQPPISMPEHLIQTAIGMIFRTADIMIGLVFLLFGLS
jgi:hypothetical protein